MAYDFTAASSRSLTANSAPVTSLPMTIAAWFNRKSSGTNHFIAAVDTSSGTGFNGLFLTASPNAVGASSNNGASFALAQTSTTYSLNEWNHGAAVFASSSSRTAYLNAGGSSTNTTAIAVSGVNNTTIGARYASGSLGAFANALIAEVGIWNVALTVAEIASLADGMTCDKVRPQSLVFYAPLVRDLQDVRGGLTITNNNTATVANHPRVYA